ncbi:MFS transporter [Robbsia sp. KACC 23696]|uniref:MFS transporter n=1 Tax=Robbsia sp. KACC 23696 TaxID=3149231 RepID=UPI00325BF85D
MSLSPLPERSPQKIGRVHYGWFMMAVTFLVLLAGAGVRATPGVMIQPLEQTFGWSAAQISSAISVNLVLYGLLGPFAAALMKTIGVRRVAVIALALLAIGALSSLFMRTPLQLLLTWGILVGTGSGMAALTLGATVANRWFTKHRGLAMGLMTASSATGQLVFLPLMAALVTSYGWRAAAWTSGLGAVIVLPVAWLCMRESPAALGLAPVGGHGPATPSNNNDTSSANPFATAINGLLDASRHGAFWLLAGSFFICGASTNGFIGTHFVSICADHGISAVHSASLLATMGIFDLFGTTLSGWLSDRFDNRRLLFWYYGLRGLSLLFLPYAFGFSFYGLPIFTVFYGLDWIATVPPTVRLTNSVFGRDKGPIIFGWIVACHQVGAAFATLVAGMMRASLGNYQLATMCSGGLCIVGALVVLKVRAGKPAAMLGSAG